MDIENLLRLEYEMILCFGRNKFFISKRRKIKMKANYKNKFLRKKQNQLNLLNSFKRNLIEGDFSGLMSKEGLQNALLLLLKT